MNKDLQAKYLMHMASKKQNDEGFTLIELLVVIIIIGILAAIALPSLLSQVNKGKQSEARQNVGAMNRAQQAYYLDNNKFSTDVSELGIGIRSQTNNYKYTMTSATANNQDAAVNNGLAIGTKLKSYSGINWTETSGNTSEALTLGTVCESQIGITSTMSNSGVTTACASNWKELK